MASPRILRLVPFAAVCVALAATGCASRPGWSMPKNPFARREISPEAEKLSKSSAELTHPGRTHMAYGQWQESLGNLVEARGSYELAQGEDPRNTDATLGLARIDALSGRTGAAEQNYLKALRAKPNDPRVLDAVGQYYASQERWSDSLRYLNEAVQAAPTDAACRYHLAVAYARSGNIEAARPHFTQAVGEAEAHYNVGYVLFDRGELEAAEREFRQALRIKPQLAQASELLDEIAHERNQRSMLAGRERDERPPAERPAERGFDEERRFQADVRPAGNWPPRGDDAIVPGGYSLPQPGRPAISAKDEQRRNQFEAGSR